MTSGSERGGGGLPVAGEVSGAPGSDPALRREQRRRARAVAAGRRAAWAGARWWAPGMLVGAGACVAGWSATLGWRAYEAGGCSSGGAMFACLGEALLAVAAAVVLGPLALWAAYRAVGVRRPALSVLVAVAVAAVLLAVPELVVQVGLLAGADRPTGEVSGAAVGALLGAAALAGGLALQGPRRAPRAAAAALALGALVVAVLLLAGPAHRAETSLDLDRAAVPLLLPDAGWRISSVHVGSEGDLSYYAVPVGWDGDGFDGVDVTVSQDVRRFGDTCGPRPCTDRGRLRVEVPTVEDPGGPTGWLLVDGVLVTVVSYDGDPAVDPVSFLRGCSPLPRPRWSTGSSSTAGPRRQDVSGRRPPGRAGRPRGRTRTP